MAENNMGIVLQQRFINGEVGERLNGMPNSEAYAMAVKTSYNLGITSIGSLRVLNRYTESTIAGVTEDILDIQDSKYNFMFLLTATKVHVFNKINRTVVATATHGVTNPTVFNSFENFVTVSNGINNIRFFVMNESTGAIGTTDYLAQITRPVRERTPLKVGIYRWFTVSEYDMVSSSYKNVKKLMKVASYTDLESCATSSAGMLLISGMRTAMRMYFIASETLTESVFEEAEWTTGDLIINFEQGLIDDLYVNGYSASFTSISTDAKGNSYATTTSKVSSGYGKGTRGVPITLTASNVRDVCVFQNRLAMITDTEIFFSSKFNYLNFLNSTEDSGAFYVKPSPIRNTQPNLRKVIASRGLWINTDLGYYTIAYDSNFSAIDSYVHIVSDRKPSLKHCIIDDILYFIDNRGVLFALQNVGEQTVKFQSVEVDKFDINRNFGYVNSIVIDGVEYVAVQDVAKPNVVYLYRQAQQGLYTRITMDFVEGLNKNFCGWNADYFKGNKLYTISNNFKTTSYIDVLPPNLQNKHTGLYLNNTYRYIKQVALKVLNEDNLAVKLIKINGIPIDRVSVDNYSVYVAITSFKINQGFRIEIEHNGNDKILEILGIEMMIQ